MDLTFTLFSLLCLLMTHTSEGTRISINKRVLPFLNRIFLRCQDNIGQDLTNTVQFYRTIHTTGNQTVTQLFTNYSLDDISVAMFYVTPETEGVYTCLDTLTNETSSNNITLVGKMLQCFLFLNIQFSVSIVCLCACIISLSYCSNECTLYKCIVNSYWLNVLLEKVHWHICISIYENVAIHKLSCMYKFHNSSTKLYNSYNSINYFFTCC